MITTELNHKNLADGNDWVRVIRHAVYHTVFDYVLSSVHSNYVKSGYNDH